MAEVHRPLHAQTWKLAEPGRDRDRTLLPAVPGQAQNRNHRNPDHRNKRLEPTHQPGQNNHRMEIHKKKSETNTQIHHHAVKVLAWIDAYDHTHDPRYLKMAETIFADMTQGWDDTCGGGIWWSKDRKYKNAIANELFLSVAAHLARRTSRTARSQYLNWGNKEWSWFRASGMINAQNLINDGLGRKSGKTVGVGCSNNGRTTWSYNQGVVLGGLAELAAVDHDPSLLESAQQIATAAITLLVDKEGVLHDPCEPRCGADAVQFKGIFVRNLVLLEKTRSQKTYISFVDTNADAIWNHAQGPGFQLGLTWSGPFDSANAASQSSALDAIVGAASLHNGPQERLP